MRQVEQTIAVRYHLFLSIAFLVIGVFNTVLGLLTAVRGDGVFLLVLGPLFVLLGTLFLVRPYFRVTPQAVEVVAPLGVGNRSYPYRTLEWDGARLIAVRTDDSRTRIPVQRWTSRGGDWKALAAATGG